LIAYHWSRNEKRDTSSFTSREGDAHDILGGEQIVKQSYAQMRKFNYWNISIVQQYGRFKESRIRSAVLAILASSFSCARMIAPISTTWQPTSASLT
jgi:hypothetical protein